MLTNEIATKAKLKYNQIIENGFIKAVYEYNKYWEKMVPDALNVALSFNPSVDINVQKEFKQSARNFYNHLQEISKILHEDIDILNFPNWMKEFLEICNDCDLFSEQEITSLKEDISRLTDLYVRFTKSPHLSTTEVFLRNINSIYIQITKLLNQLSVLDKLLSKDITIPENYSRFSIVLYNIQELPEITQKLSTFKEIYSEACLLLNVSESDYPIIIIKIETGCLSIDILGNEIISGFIVSSLSAIGFWLYRTYTTEGRIKSLSNRADHLRIISEQIECMRKNGHNVTDSKEIIDKCTSMIAKQCYSLIAKQPSFSLNDNRYSVGDESTINRYLEDSQNLIEDMTDNSQIE